MSEDMIRVPVDTTELDIAIAKAKALIAIGTTTVGTRDLTKGTRALWNDWNAFLGLMERTESDVPNFLRKFGETDLPSVNRELRLILGQIPGMRSLISDYYRLKRIQRSVGIAVEDAKMLRDVISNPQFILTVVATIVLIAKAMITYFERLKRERIAYEQFLRRERGLSKREFDTLFGNIGGGQGAQGAKASYFWSRPG